MMSNAEKQMIAVFKEFVEAALMTHNKQRALALVADDVIGIGMGAQGVVSCKADVSRIISEERQAEDTSATELAYDGIQVRCYEERYGTICGVLKLKIKDTQKTVVSALGQIMNMRKVGEQWKICALQATPLFEQIEELEAYPIKFAENVLEAYHQQEQIAKNAYANSVAIYLVNYTKGIFENTILKNDKVIPVEKGELYENVILGQAQKHLKKEERYQFISKFSLGNVLSAYRHGETELSMDYEITVSDKKSVWMRAITKLHMVKSDESLMGYLYVIDIDKEKKHELELKSKLEFDTMTGLYNKKSTELKISQQLEAAYAGNISCFFMIDLDYFKEINDTYGHLEGDRVIIKTAEGIKALLRENDIAGRIGGDEFCIYFQGYITYEEAINKAEELCEHVRKLIPSIDNATSCSIGIAFCTGSKLCFDEIYQNADQALYQQKRNGKDGYTVYSASILI